MGDAAPLIEAYLAALTHERQASRHTVAAYRRDLAELLRLTAIDGAAALRQLGQHDIRQAAMRLHGAGQSPRSIARKLSAWRGFYRWLARNAGAAAASPQPLRCNPADGVRAPKRGRDLPKALSVDQAAALLDRVPAELQDDWLALRDRAMFELFYSAGLRLAELVALDAPPHPDSGLDLVAGEVTVVGKRGKTRCVPVGSQARAALTAWLARRGERADPAVPALFIGLRGSRLAPRSIESRLTRWAQAAGLKVHPHMLRHAFASHVLQSSGDLRAVQDMLGHASIASTQIYTHLDFQHLAKVYDRAHPRARKK